MRFKKLLAASVFLAASAGVSAGSVSSMTSEQTVTGADGAKYLQSSVNCAGSSLVPTIRRPEAGGDWCGAEVEGFCSSKKMAAAKKVCGRAYTSQLRDMPAPGAAPVAAEEVAPQPAEQAPAPAPAAPAEVAPAAAPAANAAAGQQDQLEIERERLRIEQERLELRKQQVELQKQELEIKQQMESQKAAPAPAKPQPAAQPQPAPDAGAAPKKSVLGM